MAPKRHIGDSQCSYLAGGRSAPGGDGDTGQIITTITATATATATATTNILYQRSEMANIITYPLQNIGDHVMVENDKLLDNPRV